jgi:hypothetical protein
LVVDAEGHCSVHGFALCFVASKGYFFHSIDSIDSMDSIDSQLVY